MQGSLAQRANATYAGLTPAQQEIARRVLLRLIHPGEGAEDTRRRAELAELQTDPETEDAVQGVVETLAEERLLTLGLDEVSGARVVDITHEALIRGWGELRGWINEDREALRAQRHLTESASDWAWRGRLRDDLYGGSPPGLLEGPSVGRAERVGTGLRDREPGTRGGGTDGRPASGPPGRGRGDARPWSRWPSSP